MKFLWDSALGLLVVTGGLLGLTLPFGKLATAAGVPAMVWAFVISLGAGGVLAVRALGCAASASGSPRTNCAISSSPRRCPMPSPIS